MPQLTSTSLTRRSDSAAVTFSPSEIKDNVAHLVNNTGVPVGNARIGASLRFTGQRYKVKLTIAVPVVQTETVNGVDRPKVVRTSYADVEFGFSNESTVSERDDVVGYVAEMLASSNTLFGPMLTDLENVY